MKGIGTKLGYALGVLTIALPARAFAAVAGGGVLPWDAPLNTLQTAVFALKSNEGGSPAVLLAGITITLVPTLLLVIFGQRWLVRGFTAGAVK